MLALIICVGMGVFLLFLTAKGMSYKSGVTTAIGILFIVIGIAGYLLSKDIVTNEMGIKIGLFVFCYAIAIICTLALTVSVPSFFRAKAKIPATLVGKRRHGGGFSTLYTLSFNYIYKGQKITSDTKATVSWVTTGKLNIGEEYQIFIDEKNPRTIMYKRRLGFGTVCLIIMTIDFYLIPILYVTGWFSN